MAYSTDSDLQSMLPTIFSYGIASFTAYHQPAADELARDIRRLWIPRQSAITSADFEPDALDEDQMKRVACLRVLGWHVCPRLALEKPVTQTRIDAESGTDTKTIADPTTMTEASKEAQRTTISSPDFTALADAYKQAYREELHDVIEDGLIYNSNRIESINLAETQRLSR